MTAPDAGAGAGAPPGTRSLWTGFKRDHSVFERANAVIGRLDTAGLTDDDPDKLTKQAQREFEPMLTQRKFPVPSFSA